MSDTTNQPSLNAPGLVATLTAQQLKHARLQNEIAATEPRQSFTAGMVARAYGHATEIAAPYEAALQAAEAERDRLRLLACTCGVRPSPCLLCGAKAPCGLHAPGPDGKPDPEAGLVCEFDTFEGVIDALKIERRRVAELEAEVKILNKRYRELDDYIEGCLV